MTALRQLTYTIPESHIIQLPDDIPTGAKVHIVVDTSNIEEQVKQNRQKRLNHFFQWLDNRPKHSQSSAEEIEAYIQECRNDWDEREEELEQIRQGKK